MKSRIVLALLASFLSVDFSLAAVGIGNWTYDGADDTSEAFWTEIPGAFCGGSHQSPIDIVTSATVPEELPPFDLSSYDIVVNAGLENNGHAFEVDFDPDSEAGYYDITGGGLVGAFRALQFHFHFGSDVHQGSEHTIDDERYPAEMHIVHFNKKYVDSSEAMQHADGVAVLGFFFEEADHNPQLQYILDNVPEVVQPGTHYLLSDVQLSSVLPANGDLTRFWRYQGSLTTPACNEVVTWTLFREPIKLSRDQLDTMRTMVSEARDASGQLMPMENNYRSIQATNDRVVYDVTTGDGVTPSDDPNNHESPTPTAAAGQVKSQHLAFLSSLLARAVTALKLQ